MYGPHTFCVPAQTERVRKESVVRNHASQALKQMSLATALEVASSISDFVGAKLCRPGWIELALVLVLVFLAALVGCCCGVGWGVALSSLAYAGGDENYLPPQAPRIVLQAAKRRLAGYLA